MNFIKSKYFYVVVISILLLPLFYINVKDSHNWGDDFAQYFIQARNMIEHRPQTDNGLVFDEKAGEYALKAYPVGLPMMLAVSWFCFSDSVLVSSMMIAVLLFAFALAAFFYFKKYFNERLSALLTLLIVYNPWTIMFKKEILSDIPFSFFLLVSILVFTGERRKISRWIITGIIFGFAISVRGIGAVLFVACVFYQMQQLFLFLKKKNDRDEFLSSIKKTLIVTFTAGAFYFLLNNILFSIPSGSILNFYADAVKGEDFSKWIILNLYYYYEVFLNFFANLGRHLEWISTASKYLLLILLLVGIFISWKKKIGFDDWVLLAYLLVLFVYPYLGGGFRFLLPIMPMLMKYIFNAVIKLINLPVIASQKPAYVFAIIILLQYTPGFIDQVNSMDIPEQGPQGQQAKEVFTYIEQQLPADAVIVFLKPRALAFYTNKNTTYAGPNIREEELLASFRGMNAHYFLLCSESDEVNDVLLKKFVAQNGSSLKIVMKNNFFDLYSDLK